MLPEVLAKPEQPCGPRGHGVRHITDGKRVHLIPSIRKVLLPSVPLPWVQLQHSRLRASGTILTQHSTAPVCRAAQDARDWSGMEKKETQTPLIQVPEGRSKS